MNVPANKTFVLLTRPGTQVSSKRPEVKTTSHREWPVELKVAGVSIGMTEAGARELAAQLQTAVRP